MRPEQNSTYECPCTEETLDNYSVENKEASKQWLKCYPVYGKINCLMKGLLGGRI